MRAIDEIKRLQEKLADGSLPPDEPLFVLRAQDKLAAGVVRVWAIVAETIDTPRQKIDEAYTLAELMKAWPVKQTPGRPETRTTSSEPPP